MERLWLLSQWQASMEFEWGCRNLVFPAPELDDDTYFNPATHGKPDFTDTGLLFWADEQTHKAKETT